MKSFFILLTVLFLCGCSKQEEASTAAVYTLHRGDLDVTILTNGSLDTASPTNIIQKIGRTAKIVDIVPEGTIITQQDIDNKRIIIQFDGKDIEDLVYERQLNYENALANSINADESLEIQKSDNDSNIRKAELDVIYAQSDLEKLVGDKLALRYRDKLPEEIAALLEDPELDGSVRLDLMTYRSDIELAQTKLNRAEQTLEYTTKLYKKQFVSKNDFENDQLDVQSQKKSLQATTGKYDIFRRFDFIKNFHRTWATAREARSTLNRVQRSAKIRLAIAETRQRNAKNSLTQATKRLEEARESLNNCTIRATVPGMVVYQPQPRWTNSGPVQAGTEIRNQQVVIRLPDLNQMLVKTNIHESQIDQIAEKMKAVISIDALPGRKFSGYVSTKGLLPSAENEWLNPDLKVYEVKISFEKSEDCLRPGMTASVKIIIDELKDVLYVPLQSVRTDSKGIHYCYLENGSPREVKLGKRNRSFVVVTEGLSEGDRILMTAPEAVASESKKE